MHNSYLILNVPGRRLLLQVLKGNVLLLKRQWGYDEIGAGVVNVALPLAGGDVTNQRLVVNEANTK